jgi:hypothetical protein
MKGLATTGSGAETQTTSPLPTIATGARARLAGGYAANDNGLSLARRLLAPAFFAASVVLLLLVL